MLVVYILHIGLVYSMKNSSNRFFQKKTTMADETIDLIIHADGRVEIQVCGVKGERCLEVTKAVEEVLGNKLERQVTSEMYETDESDETTSETQKLGH